MSKKLALITGSAAGLLYTVSLFIAWSLGVKSLAGFMTWYTYLPVIFLIIGGGAWWLRSRMIPFDFKTILQYAVLAYLVYEIIYAVANYSLFSVIDKEVNNQLVQELLNESLRKLKAKGASSDQIEATMKMADTARGPLTFSQLVLGFGQNMILNFLKSIFIATITKQTNSRKA